MSEGVTLVSSEECGGVSVTPEQAKQVNPVLFNNLRKSLFVCYQY